MVKKNGEASSRSARNAEESKKNSGSNPTHDQTLPSIYSFTEQADESYLHVREHLSKAERARLRLQRDYILFKMCLRSEQLWIIYLMASLSILFGYYSVDVFKTFGQSVPELSDDRYLTWVGSMAALFNAARFIWSACLDHYSYKEVYGVLLLLQIFLAATMSFAIKSKAFYLSWICLALLCEGGHFTLVPNILKKIFGRQATSLYGVAFSYTGLTSLLMIGLLEAFAESYLLFYALTAVFSLLSLLLLHRSFSEVPFTPDQKQLVAELRQTW